VRLGCLRAFVRSLAPLAHRDDMSLKADELAKAFQIWDRPLNMSVFCLSGGHQSAKERPRRLVLIHRPLRMPLHR